MFFSSILRYIHNLQCIDVTDEKNHPSKILEKQYKVRKNNGRITLFFGKTERLGFAYSFPF